MTNGHEYDGDTRRRWVLGIGVLREFLVDPLVAPRLLKAKRWEELSAAADLAHDDAPPELALTDPVLYRSLREAITLWHMKGWGAALDRDKLRIEAVFARKGRMDSPPRAGRSF